MREQDLEQIKRACITYIGFGALTLTCTKQNDKLENSTVHKKGTARDLALVLLFH